MTYHIEHRAPAWDRLSPEERAKIKQALAVADAHGYGNLMAWIATEWALKLEDQGLTLETAIDAVSERGPYHIRGQGNGISSTEGA